MAEGNGTLAMVLGNYCLSGSQVDNPIRQRKLHTYTKAGKKILAMRTTTENQMIQ